jgi:protein-S-isoprenylcysteine O-methyltransferase Ste14
MKATDFEYRHQVLLHLLVVGMAFLTYAFQPDDIVWALVKRHGADRALLERLIFGIGALMAAGSAMLLTWASAYRNPASTDGVSFLSCDGPYRHLQHPLHLGRLLFALGIGMLAPAWGTLVLLMGETFLVMRLIARGDEGTEPESEFLRQYRARVPRFWPARHPYFPPQGLGADWKQAVCEQASKWGLAATMVVFTLTLQDRLAETLAGLSFLLWAALNLPHYLRSRARGDA